MPDTGVSIDTLRTPIEEQVDVRPESFTAAWLNDIKVAFVQYFDESIPGPQTPAIIVRYYW